MALIKTGGPRDYCYAAIRNVEGDASNNSLRVNVGLWYDEEDRRTGIAENERMPKAKDFRPVILPDLYDVLKTLDPYPAIYAAILALPEWAEWSSDIPTGA